jgi:hypothetical protein
MATPPARIHLGGEGEEPGVLNQQGPWVLDPNWRSSRGSKTLTELLAQGHAFVIADNLHLPFASDYFDEVITNAVPIDFTTHLGPGVQSSEIRRILKPGGVWIDNRTARYVKP